MCMVNVTCSKVTLEKTNRYGIANYRPPFEKSDMKRFPRGIHGVKCQNNMAGTTECRVLTYL